MTTLIADWLIDTFLITGLLIAGVLLARRPVTRHFGPQVAYALWALPLLRLVMPPLVLPAWMAPAPEPLAADVVVPRSGEPLLVLVTDIAPAAAAPPMGLDPLALLVPLWLGGAAIFLFWRTRTYVRMRRALLAEARPVGEADRVRLVETPAVASPLAFGVFDKVVALPPRFMAHHDRDARDLAIAHELAHHRGGDLVANIAAQPLLALHWFNPLAWAGWRAMRRDQEAACDARVVAGRGRIDRALYASVIAGFAASDSRVALAVPMACPVLGEKSIIHRLRSLAMSEIPARRRRYGLLAIGAVALGLPLTASITYAAPTPPEPPVAPAPPGAVPLLPADPRAPAPPLPVEPLDPDERRASAWHRGQDVSTLREESHSPDEAALERMFAQFEQEEGFAEHLEAQIEAHEEAFAAMEEAFAERERALEEAAEAREEALAHMEVALRGMPQVTTTARCEGDDPVIERDLGDGRRAIMICNEAISARAVDSLRDARRAIARENEMPPEQRAEVLRQLDREIERLAGQRLSVSMRYEAIRPVASLAAVFAVSPATPAPAERRIQASARAVPREACAIATSQIV